MQALLFEPEEDSGPIPIHPFTPELKEIVVRSWLLHFPTSRATFNPWGGCSDAGLHYDGRPEYLHVRFVDRKKVDVKWSWTEFHQIAKRLSTPSLF